MAQPPRVTADYRRLLDEIRKEMERGFRKVEELLERQKVLSYWAIGRKIHTYLNTHDQPRGAIGEFYEDLSKDLGIHDRTLQQCEQFFRFFPKLKPHPALKWSHYRFLLSVPDESKRQAWLVRIQKENMAADELRLALMPPREKMETAAAALKIPARGKLYTYRLLRADDIENFETPWFVDLGFASRREAPASKAVLDNKHLYTSEKLKSGYRLKVTDAKTSELFTFAAKLRRVIDGDTLLVAVDQGFSCWTEQRLRFLGIDAPELDTLAGARAKKWLEDKLADSRTIIVKTYKSDNWDRYLVDLFYLPQEADMRRVAAEGIWLNGEMVKEGIARVWHEKDSC